MNSPAPAQNGQVLKGETPDEVGINSLIVSMLVTTLAWSKRCSRQEAGSAPPGEQGFNEFGKNDLRGFAEGTWP
jgi:hypothetical protein